MVAQQRETAEVTVPLTRPTEARHGQAEKNGHLNGTSNSKGDSPCQDQSQKSAAQKGQRSRNRLHINKRTLPIKALYFVANSAFCCILPYLVIYMRLQGLTSSETGVIIGLMPFFAFVAQPLASMAADRWSLHKVALVVAILLTGVGHLLISVVPARSKVSFLVGELVVTCHPRQPLVLNLTHCGQGNITSVPSERHRRINVSCAESVSGESAWSSESSVPCDDSASVTSVQTSDKDCPRSLRDVLLLSHLYGDESLRGSNKDSDQILIGFCTVTCPKRETKNYVQSNICLVSNEDKSLNASDFAACRSSTRKDLFPSEFMLTSFRDHTDSSSSSSINHNGSIVRLDDISRDENCFEKLLQVTSLQVNRVSYNTVLCDPIQSMRCTVRCQLASQAEKVCAMSTKRPLSAQQDTESWNNVSHFPWESSSMSSPTTVAPNGVISNVLSSSAEASGDLTFWLTFFLYLLGYLGFSLIPPMLDTTCYSLLKDDWQNFGQNRLFGTMGWSVVSVATSVGVYLGGGLRYSFLFFSFGVLSACSAVLAACIPLPRDMRCGNVLRNMRQVLALRKVVIMLSVVMVIGMQFGAVSFIMWFLEENLGAPDTIFGPVIFMGGITEIPSLFLAGRFINKFGPIPCVCFAVFVNSLRLLGYTLLQNPWLVLLLEPLHGMAAGQLMAAASVYMTWVTPPGLSASSQGLLSAVLWSFGRGTGVVLAGRLFSVIGARWTFLAFACLGMVTTVVYSLLYFCVLGRDSPPVTNIEIPLKDNQSCKVLVPEPVVVTVEPAQHDVCDVTEHMLPSDLGAVPLSELT